MRAMKWIFVVMGAVFITVGVAAIVWAIADDSSARWGVGIGVGSLAFAGVVFLLVARYIGRLDTSAVIANGIPGTAEVVRVRDTGVTIHNVNAVFGVLARVTIPTTAPYETEFRVTLNRAQWGQIQPGMILAVKVDPDDPSKVAIDPDRPARAAAGQVTGPPIGATFDTADIIRRGVATTGQVHSVTPTGVDAGQLTPGLATHEADDPLVLVAFRYAGPGGAAMQSQAVMRVPDGRSGGLTSGAQVPVRYLADRPDVATIDWERM